MEDSKNKAELPDKNIPILPLLERPLFPDTFTTLMIGRDQDVRVINKVIASSGYFGALMQGASQDYRSVGTLARITRFIRLPNNSLHVFISTIKRFEVEEMHYQEDGTVTADIKDYNDENWNEKAVLPYVRVLRDTISNLSQTSNLFAFGSDVNVANIDDPSLLSFFTASALNASGEFLQDILETRNARTRIEKILTYVAAEKQVIDKENEIKSAVFDRARNKNKEQVLREQIKSLNQELAAITGAPNSAGSASDSLARKAAEKQMPPVFREALEKELEKMSMLDLMNPEYSLAKTYVETILALPFSFSDDPPSYSIKNVKDVLEKDHYGMKEVKERILEFLASRLKAKNSKGAIILLAGPPGVGKTSVGYSIARALGKKFFRFSVGGMRDEAEIKGHRRTYVGAMPGKIIQGMKTTGVPDPVFLIDEIDKMGESFRGDPASALLEVLDPEQNSNFQDFYLDLPYDLSKVLFIVTANDVSRIPEPLLDRMEIIELSGYTPGEKIHIGQDYLVPKMLRKNGLLKKELRFDRNSLRLIAEEYAREAGVRNFEKSIDKIARKVALEILENPEIKLPVSVKSKASVEKYLGKPLFPSDEITKADKPGTAIGLAWTSMGGDVLLIEAESLPFKGELKVTGQLGQVMQESVSIAWSTLKNEAYLRGQDLGFFDNMTVHLHIPEGAVPKDGPSAGITLFTALWSMYTKQVIKKDLAMTGELTLTGKVMPIGGLKEKVLAAKRNGIREIIIPERNRRDLEKLGEEVTEGVEFHLVSQIIDVLSIAFPDDSTRRLSEKELEELAQSRKQKEEEQRKADSLMQAEAFGKVLKWQ